MCMSFISEEPQPGPRSTSSSPSVIQPNPDEDSDSSDSDDCVNFSTALMRRHKMRKNPTAHIGADNNELYEDPADVAYKNWGHVPTLADPADVMFANTPPPVVVSVF